MQLHEPSADTYHDLAHNDAVPVPEHQCISSSEPTIDEIESQYTIVTQTSATSSPDTSSVTTSSSLPPVLPEVPPHIRNQDMYGWRHVLDLAIQIAMLLYACFDLLKHCRSGKGKVIALRYVPQNTSTRPVELF